jgi:hypothetical protein
VMLEQEAPGQTHIQDNRQTVTLSKGARDLVIATVMALSILVNVVLFGWYLDSQRTVADAYKDLKTQVWVRQDKDEEKFQKFVAGPYAQLAGKVEASQILFSKCKESK